jgi:hypothetical protein
VAAKNNTKAATKRCLRMVGILEVRAKQQAMLIGVFNAQFVEEFFTIGGHVPGIRPEAQIDAPPVVGHAAIH